MDPLSVYGVYQSQYLYEAVPAQRSVKSPTAGVINRGDTVSFSEEALSLASSMTARKGYAEESGTDGGGQTDQNANSEKRRSAGSGGSLASLSETIAQSDLYADIHQVEREVQDLGKTLRQVMAGVHPIDVKMRMSEPIQQRLQDRRQELQTLRQSLNMVV